MIVITVARKPLQEGTVAANVLTHGTGALNIDGCRIEFVSEADKQESTTKNQHADFGTPPLTGNTVYGDYSMVAPKNYSATGRWPANLILQHLPECTLQGVAAHPYESSKQSAQEEVWQCVPECPVAHLGEQTGVLKSGKMTPTFFSSDRQVLGADAKAGYVSMETYGDIGTAARFFKQVQK